MLGHILLISAQVNSRAACRCSKPVTFGVFAEVQRGDLERHLGVPAASGAATSACARCRSENEALQAQLDSAQIELQEQRALADRTRGLEQLLELREQAKLKTTAAEIIAAGATPEFRTLTIDKGTARRADAPTWR